MMRSVGMRCNSNGARWRRHLVVSVALLCPVGITPLHAQTKVTAADTQVEAIEQALGTMTRAVNAGDARRYAALYAADARIVIFGGESLRGRAAIEQYEEELLRQFPGTRLSFYSTWIAGLDVVVHYAVNSPIGNGRMSGHEGLLFYRFDSAGTILEERRYLDAFTPMAQVGALKASEFRSPPALAQDVTIYWNRVATPTASNEASVTSFLNAVETGRIAAANALLDRAPEIDDLMLPRRADTPERVEDWYRTWTTNVRGLQITTSRVVATGAWVLVEMTWRGTLDGAVGMVNGKNQPFTLHRAALFELANGKILSARFFGNSKELASSVK